MAKKLVEERKTTTMLEKRSATQLTAVQKNSEKVVNRTKTNLKQKESGVTLKQCYLDMFSTYEDIVTPDDVAAMMHLPVKRIYRMIRAGEIESIKLDRAVRIAKIWVIEYIQKYGLQRQESFRLQRKAAVTVFCQTPKSRKQIQEFLDLSDKKFFMDAVLHPLLEDGVLRMTIPEQPSNVKQRYIATRVLSPEECKLIEVE